MSERIFSNGIDPSAPQGQADLAGRYNSRGVTFWKTGDMASAIADLDEAVRLDPQFAEAYSNRGAVCYTQDNYVRAIADFSTALRINPSHAVLYNNRGSARLAAWDFHGAVADFDVALEIDPQYCRAYLSRGLAYYHLRDPRAEFDYRVAFRLNPGFAAHHLVGLLAKSVELNPRAVLTDCGHHLRHNPDDYHSLARRVLLRLLQGDATAAQPDFDRYRQLNPDGAFKLGLLIDEARRYRDSKDSRQPLASKLLTDRK